MRAPKIVCNHPTGKEWDRERGGHIQLEQQDIMADGDGQTSRGEDEALVTCRDEDVAG